MYNRLDERDELAKRVFVSYLENQNYNLGVTDPLVVATSSLFLASRFMQMQDIWRGWPETRYDGVENGTDTD